MTTNTGGPAFPGLHPSKECHFQDSGMTLRDYFAAKAMQGIYACPDHVTEPDGSGGPDPLTDSDIARLAYAMADAMLKAREA
jgi:hypothetical protein